MDANGNFTPYIAGQAATIGTTAGTLAAGNDARFPTAISGLRKGNGTSADTAAVAADVVGALGYTPLSLSVFTAGDISCSSVNGPCAVGSIRSVPVAPARSVVCTAGTDCGPAIMTALTAVQGTANTSVRVSGACQLQTQVTQSNWSGLKLLGNGVADFGLSPTKCTWTGPAGASGGAVAMLDLTSPGNGYATSGFVLDGIEFDSGTLANECVKMRGLSSSYIHAHCDDATTAGYDIDISPQAAGGSGATSKNHFDLDYNTSVAQASATGAVTAGSTTITLTAANPAIVPNMWIYAQGMPYKAQVATVSGTTLVFKSPSGNGASYGGSFSLSFFTNYVVGVLIGRGPDITTHQNLPDVTLNDFDRIVVNPGVGPGIDCGSADGNNFGHITVTGGPGAGFGYAVPGATIALRLEGGVTGEGDSCHHNSFGFSEILGRLIAENGTLVQQAFFSASIAAGTNQLVIGTLYSGSFVTGQAVNGPKTLPPGLVITSQISANPLTYGLNAVVPNGASGAFIAGTANAYAAQGNVIRGLGTGDSFTYYDFANGPGSSVDSANSGNGQPNLLNPVDTDNGLRFLGLYAGLNLSSFPAIGPYQQTGFMGSMPLSGACPASFTQSNGSTYTAGGSGPTFSPNYYNLVASPILGTDNGFSIVTPTGCGSAITITLPTTHAFEPMCNITALSATGGAAVALQQFQRGLLNSVTVYSPAGAIPAGTAFNLWCR